MTHRNSALFDPDVIGEHDFAGNRSSWRSNKKKKRTSVMMRTRDTLVEDAEEDGGQERMAWEGNEAKRNAAVNAPGGLSHLGKKLPGSEVPLTAVPRHRLTSPEIRFFA